MRPVCGVTKRFTSNAFVLLAAMLLLAGSINIAWAGDRDDSDQRYGEEADTLYEEGHYDKAFDKYIRLAKKGDPYSQYRTSYMYLMGEGTGQNYANAFAWAALAKEHDVDALNNYFQEVKAQIPEDQRDAAQKKAEYTLRKWGKVALAIEGRRKAKRELRGCTGSRLGTRCDEVFAVQMPKFWGINPGDGTGADGGSAAPSGSVSTPGMGVGGEERDAEYYQELREYTAQLDQYIEQNAGTVEIGEFEVIEPDQESGRDAVDEDR